jgi:hypothetical protein
MWCCLQNDCNNHLRVLETLVRNTRGIDCELHVLKARAGASPGAFEKEW